MQDLFGKDLGGLMAQLQQAQSKMAELEQSVGSQVVEGEAGGGLVKCLVNGKQELVSIRIDPKVIDPSDPAMLEDLIHTAVNRALNEAKELMQREVSGSLLGGGLPGMF
jgi:DNA-binding YbaB/EbfC family protein